MTQKERLFELIKSAEGLIKDLDTAIATVKADMAAIETNSEPYHLFVSVDDLTTMFISYYNDDGDVCDLGYVTEDGECYILDTMDRKKDYEIWLEHGMKVDSKEAVWKGSSYCVSKNRCLENIALESNIYDFELGFVCDNCIDKNIERYTNNTPKLY